MKCIDMRCRPPVASLIGSRIYDAEFTTAFGKRFGNSYPAESAKNRSIEQLVQEMDACGIEKGVFAVRRDHSKTANDEALEVLQKYPEHFLALVGCDFEELDVAMVDIDRYALNGPFSGVTVEPGNPAYGYRSWFVDDERLFPLYEKCEQNNLPLVITVCRGSMPDATAFMPIRIENVAHNFPKLNFAISHAAWPWFTQLCGVCMKYPTLRIITDSYILKLPGYQDCIDAGNYLLTDQILFGSSYPYNDQKFVYDFYMKEAGFRPEVLPKIMYKNAAKFLNLTVIE